MGKEKRDDPCPTPTTSANAPRGRAVPAVSGRQDSSFDLDAAMRERMTNTFGDLSALRDWQPPVREAAPAQAGPYTGPVTHALSSASPSPAAAGPMQARRYDTTRDQKVAVRSGEIITEDEEGYGDLGADKYVEYTQTPTKWGRFWGEKQKRYKAGRLRKAYELDEEELKANRYNPENLKQLNLLHQQMEETGRKKKVKKQGDEIGNRNRGAWQALKRFFGNDQEGIYDEEHGSWKMNEIDNGIFLAKMKNMGRMMNDYPQLRTQLGSLNRENVGEMATGQVYKDRMGEGDVSHMFPLFLSSETDAVGKEAAENRAYGDLHAAAFNTHAADSEYSGNHELGHMLNFDLVRRKNWDRADSYKRNKTDMTYHITADRLVEQALKNTLSEEEFGSLERYDRDSTKKDVDEKGNRIYFKKGQINLKASNLGPQKVHLGGNRYRYTKGHSSKYGTTNASEFFAEAFADVYQHGRNARKASIELVKAYEAEFQHYNRVYRTDYDM